jgi:hypothetical protein
MGLIATNTIGQGDTRSTGLRWICKNGGTIYRATKRLKWPGEAAVVVSVIHVSKGELLGPFILDGRYVPTITAYLFHAGGSGDPACLLANADQSFAGSFVLGMGFTFDDTDKKAIASPLSEMQRLIEKDPRNASRIFPFIGGEEINASSTHAYHRYVIDFESFPLERRATGHSWHGLREETQRQQLREGVVAPDYPFPVAADWPDLLKVVRERVKPARDGDNRANYSRLWWQFAERRPGLTRALSGKTHVIAQSRISSWLSFVLLETGVVFDITINVFPIKRPMNALPVLQSRLHEVWARFFASSLEDRLRYTPSDCFETFPFPNDYESNTNLEAAGRTYYEFRADLMIRNDDGLTKTYNRFHDPNDDSMGIRCLRELHDFMDRAVLDAYGWQDIPITCDFFPEFDDEDEEDEGERPKKKKYRYRWPDEVHDEVLARLLDLNRQRALEEGQLPTGDQPSPVPRVPPKKRSSGKSKGRDRAPISGLFAVEEEKA